MSSHARKVTMDTFKAMSQDRPITLFVYATMNGYKGPICAEELGIDYNYVVIDFEKGEQKSSEYLKLNPKGQIPALYDDDCELMLAESAAILEYLADKYRAKKPTLFSRCKQRHSDALGYSTMGKYMITCCVFGARVASLASFRIHTNTNPSFSDALFRYRARTSHGKCHVF